MSRTAASPEILPEFAAGVVVSEIALASAAGKPATPVRIKIGPRGAFTARDGRAFTFNPEALVARFAADGVDVPVDLDHGIVEKRVDGVAKGWVKKLEAAADGLYAEVEWLDGGKAVLAARTHRYVSPSFHHDASGAATWIHSVSLVPAPALPGAAVASATGAPASTPLPETSMKGIATALGLQADANEQACLSALSALKDGAVDRKVHDTTLASLQAATNELEAIKAAERKTRVDTVIDGALKAKKIMPAEKDAYVALCSTDAGLEQVEKLIAAKPAMLSASGLDSRQAPAGVAAADANPVALAAKAQMHQAELAARGVTISISEAVNHVASLEAR